MNFHIDNVQHSNLFVEVMPRLFIYLCVCVCWGHQQYDIDNCKTVILHVGGGGGGAVILTTVWI